MLLLRYTQRAAQVQFPCIGPEIRSVEGPPLEAVVQGSESGIPSHFDTVIVPALTEISMTLGNVYDLDLKKNETVIKEVIIQAQGE
ncbi:hypothetical protein MPER_15653, partial [Moniliophthora perniciosa FA553]